MIWPCICPSWYLEALQIHQLGSRSSPIYSLFYNIVNEDIFKVLERICEFMYFSYCRNRVDHIKGFCRRACVAGSLSHHQPQLCLDSTSTITTSMVNILFCLGGGHYDSVGCNVMKNVFSDCMDQSKSRVQRHPFSLGAGWRLRVGKNDGYHDTSKTMIL